MKKTLIRLLGIFALTSALIVPQLGAVPTLLTTASNSYVGVVTPGVPSSGAAEEDYINHLRTLAAPSGPTLFDGQSYTRSNKVFNPALPEAEFTSKSDNSNTNFSLVDFTGYILGKYDASNAGSRVWYLVDFTGDIVLPALFGRQYGLSHTSFFGGTPTTNIPDGGTTAVLLGLGLVALSLINRRRSIV